MTNQDLATYLTRILHLPWEGSRIEELLHVARESLGVPSVSLETPMDRVSVVAPDSTLDAVPGPDAMTELTIDEDWTLIIRSRGELTDSQLADAHVWAGLVKIVHVPADERINGDFDAALRTVRHALEALDDEAEIAQYVIRAALRTVGGDAAWYAARTDDGLVIRADSGFDDPNFARAWMLKVGEGVGGRAFSHGQTVIANDYLHDRRRVKTLAKMADREGVRSVVTAPVRRGDSVDGALYLMSRRTHMFHRRESDRLTVLGEELGYALDRIATVAGLSRRADDAHERAERLLASSRATRTGMEALLSGASIDSALAAVSRTSGMAVEVVDDMCGPSIIAGDTDRPERRRISVTGPNDETASLRLYWDGPDDESTELLAEGVGHLVRLHWVNEQNDVRLRQRFMATLLRDRIESEGETVREALIHGLDLFRDRVVAYLAPSAESCAAVPLPQRMGDGVAEHLERSVAGRLKSSLCVWFDDGLAVVADLAVNTTTEVSDALASTTEDRQLLHLSLVGGIGGACNRPEDYARSWREAQLAAAFAKRRQTGTVVAITELGAFAVFAHADVASRLVGDVGRLLGPLRGMPEPMIETLDAYVHSGYSVEDAARYLHVHANTLRYRLRRAQERHGLDLGHGDQRFLLELGLRARRLMMG